MLENDLHLYFLAIIIAEMIKEHIAHTLYFLDLVAEDWCSSCVKYTLKKSTNQTHRYDNNDNTTVRPTWEKNSTIKLLIITIQICR